ncbi:MAG: 30S ribosomal protein S5 [Candidatus Collierbacteria bacterium GW2011_GWA2_44_99]|uniref:Small ribosomal subunit protein uS5 n=1 Tax=Candidatus Collierbacteria bacterium GW2011_GWA2_44_99 TaxID=1618380 RepID=A0A0G1NNB6_9BACT|nr:MAG: 30S ribosomal protein S5 [Candidatus Collierbacteria bacterium GW2011_GWA2_44_99]
MAYTGNTNNSNRGGGRPAPEGFEQVLQIRRVSKKTQGGTNVSFSALVVTGDKKGKVGAAKVLFRPAPKGTGLIAGSSVRAVVEAAGITDIVCKVLGTNNKTSNARATFKALKQIETLGKKYQLLKALRA